MKTGLILEGGAMRGMFTAGVMDMLMENGIEFDGGIGVSAGAAFGVNYKSRQIGRVIRYNKKFCNDKRYSGLHTLLTDGNLYSTTFCYGEVPLKYDVFDFDTYRQNPMEFYVVCTDIETGLPFYRKYEGWEDHGFDWIRASASMPIVSQIVEIDGHKYLDGGIADSIPIRFFESLGYDRNVVILTQPKNYVKKKNELIPLLKLQYRNYPKMVEAMERRHTVYNETLAHISRKEKAGKLLVIRPGQKLEIGRAEKNPDRLQAVYDIGRQAAFERLGDIRLFLAPGGSDGKQKEQGKMES